MAKRRKEKTDTKVQGIDSDVTTTPEGCRVLGMSYYVRRAKAAMEERDWYIAWLCWGSALARVTDAAEEWDMRQLEKKAYRLLLNRKGDRKKDKDKRRMRREYT